jgi:pullulanase/glycogen debranching enzyme
MFGYRIGDPAADLSRDDRDNAAFAPLAAVIDPAFDWQGDRPPATPWHKTVIYEAHVKGFTALHTDDRHLVERGLTKLGAFFDVITGGEAFRLGDRSLALFLGVPG